MSATDPPSLSRRGRGRGRLTVATLHWMTGPGPGSQMVTLSVSMFLGGVLLVYILDPRDLSSSHELHFYMKKKIRIKYMHF